MTGGWNAFPLPHICHIAELSCWLLQPTAQELYANLWHELVITP